MTCALIIRPEAEADLSRAPEWYEIRSQGLGNAFLDEANRFLETIRRLEKTRSTERARLAHTIGVLTGISIH